MAAQKMGFLSCTKGRGQSMLTSQECQAWTQQLGCEKRTTRRQMLKDTEKVGDIYRCNDYCSYFKRQGGPKGPSELIFSVEKVRDETEYDPRSRIDTRHPAHERRKRGLHTGRQITSSQAYGWYRPVDKPKCGQERSSVCQANFQDFSHLSSTWGVN
eukprot:gnl/MRDRNA2_/MRDRNA2_113444_c0_seq1.p1 gnl/MRDRNA2_/MRDRNA2_113444_c0~~gnl/MRDRNA2_/MRDRNA2_113444_c0_seq1.p1  ORF type:complete len:157 (-),score=20.95 gnl/MRDRNA2_/MRDRNA2_113444_c0_seq1:48-518(-)